MTAKTTKAIKLKVNGNYGWNDSDFLPDTGFD